MLIDFTVENFRSFGDAQTFSMIASKDASHQAHVVEKGRSAFSKRQQSMERTPPARAILSRRSTSWSSSSKSPPTKMNLGDPIADVEPFRLSRDWRSQTLDVRHPPAHQRNRVPVRTLSHTRESPQGMASCEARRWPSGSGFLREYGPGKDTTQWHTRGELKEQAKAAIKATRDNGLFLSQAAQMNVEFVKELFLWFRRCLWRYDLSNLDVRSLGRTDRHVGVVQPESWNAGRAFDS